MWATYGDGHEKHNEDPEKVQRGARKTVPGLKDLHYNLRLGKLNLSTLAYRCVRGDMIQVFKILHDDPKFSNDKTISKTQLQPLSYPHPYVMRQQCQNSGLI